jgi:hypothetical protein
MVNRIQTRTLATHAATSSWIALLGVVSLTVQAHAADIRSEPAENPSAAAARLLLLHTPISIANEQEPLVLAADFSHPEDLRQAILSYRTASQKQYREVPFRRSAHSYRAVVPGADVQEGLAYLIELELANGERIVAFASRSAPFQVQVQLRKDDADELAAARRLSERRSVTTLRGEWVTFGESDPNDSAEPLDATLEPPESGASRADDYYRLEASYAYRPLRLVNEFGVRLGLVRGSSPRDASDLGSPEVGLNYAAPWLRLRLEDVAFATVHVVTGVTEVDFSLGAGIELTFGDPYGASLDLGFEYIEGFGSRLFTRLNILASDRVRLSPMIEATDMPNARDYGVRLLGELGWEVTPELELTLHGGYQARAAVSGGVSLGAGASLAF